MDAFFASVEQLDFPNLIGKPVAVGGGEDRGVVAAASYEARKFGVKSAMSGRLAKQLCPELIFMPVRFERYREVSRKIREIFYEYTDLVEPLSLDEAYLDVTENKTGNPSATLIAKEIREKIKLRTELNASAGISINKFVAKIASDVNKPNGQKTVPPEEVLDFLEKLEIRKFYGVGKITAEKMYQLGIFTGKDLKQKTAVFLNEHFGKSGMHYFNIVRGVQHSEVKPNRPLKSLGAEHTFRKNISSEVFMLGRLETIAAEIAQRLDRRKVAGKTITLKIKYSDFTLKTRSKTLDSYISAESVIFQTTKELLYQEKVRESVRLLGISVSNFNTEQLSSKKRVEIQLKFDF